MIGFILITTDLGMEKKCLNAIKLQNYIKTAIPVFGAYDIIVKIETPTEEATRRLLSNIRNLVGVKHTLTLIVVD